MKVITTLCLAMSLIIFANCRQNKETFPEEKSLESYQKTEFAPTLESPIHKGKNSIYCSTLLLAWDQVRQKSNGKIEVESHNKQLYTLNASNSFQRSLSLDEYTCDVEFGGEKMAIDVALRLSLPFEKDLDDLKGRLVFNGSKVASFGAKGKNELIDLPYYESDSQFILKLRPINANHEIFLFKTNWQFKSLGVMLKDFNDCLSITHNAYINENDIVVIPKLRFNIGARYPEMERQLILANGQYVMVEEVRQQIAFVLNEHGAELESKAQIKVLGNCRGERDYKPKKLVFDSPFYLVIRKRGTGMMVPELLSPYFAMKISNPELMEKE
jgi:hypothetical protein